MSDNPIIVVSDLEDIVSSSLKWVTELYHIPLLMLVEILNR